MKSVYFETLRLTFREKVFQRNFDEIHDFFYKKPGEGPSSKSFFTNVPLEYTIDVILRKVYEEKLIKTDIPKKEMKQLLLLCTKNVHFEFNGETFQDGVAMGSPFGPSHRRNFHG